MLDTGQVFLSAVVVMEERESGVVFLRCAVVVALSFEQLVLVFVCLESGVFFHRTNREVAAQQANV